MNVEAEPVPTAVWNGKHVVCGECINGATSRRNSASVSSQDTSRALPVETSRRSMDNVMDPLYTGFAAACTR